MDDSDCQIIDPVDSEDDGASVIFINESPNKSTQPNLDLKPSEIEPIAGSSEFFRFSAPTGLNIESRFESTNKNWRNRDEENKKEAAHRLGKQKTKRKKRKDKKKVRNMYTNLSIEGLSLQSENSPPNNFRGNQANQNPRKSNSPKNKFTPRKGNKPIYNLYKSNEPAKRRSNESSANKGGACPPTQPLMSIQNVVSSNKRFIVIDGSNVAVTHGIDVTQKKAFSCMGIKLTVDYFARRGHTQIKALVPRFRRGTSDHQCPTLNPEILDELEKKGYLTYTPSRYVENKLVIPYDDRFILKTALHYNAVIVSNDNYRDLWNEDQQWKKLIQTNLLQYSFINDLFLIADDPFGRDGPTIDQFLSIDYLNNNTANTNKKR